MKISVIMACYNGKEYLGKQLDSIRKQTRRADECILVDDCSVDGTDSAAEEYLEKYKCPGWRIIKNSRNLGYIKTFEKAMSLATGDIVFLSDQDDIWSRKKIERMERVMEKYPEILSLSTGFRGIDENGAPISVRSPFLTENHGLILLKKMRKNGLYHMKYEDVVQRNIAMGCTMAVRRELIGLYLESPATEAIPHDWKLNFLAGVQNGLYFWNRELIRYRIHSGNTIGMKVESSQIDRDYRVREYGKYLRSYQDMKIILEALEEKGRDVKIPLEKVMRTEEFYRGRIKAMKKRNLLRTIGLVNRFAPEFGLYAVLAFLDILHCPVASDMKVE